MPVRYVSFLILFLFSFSCPIEASDTHQKGNPAAAKAIDEVLKEHGNTLMSIPGVVGTGQGLWEGKPCIKVFVIQKTPDLDQAIPPILDGYPVRIEETGPIKALPRK